MPSKPRDELTFHLGIDVGSSSVKAMLASDDGTQVSVASAPCSMQHPQPGHAEADPELWWDAVVEAVTSLDTAGARIRGIGVSVLYPALLLLDANMLPLRPAILYCDGRSDAESEELLRHFGHARACELTGNAFPAGSAAITSLLWLRKHEPETFERADRIGLANTFIVHKLTGEFTTDFSNASLSGLYDTGANEWSAELCTLAGIAQRALPPPMPGGQPAGRLSREAAAQLQLPAGLPVAAGAGDTVCSALGIGITAPAELFVSCGSTNCFAGLSERPGFDNGLVNTSYLDDRTWINIGSTNASGSAIDWFVRTFLGVGADAYERFFDLCGRSSPGAGGIVFLPYLAGERTPLYDPRARALFFGMSMASSLADTARSVAEGVCHADRHILETFQRNGRKVRSILAAGGGNRSRTMRRIRTDVIGVEIAFSGLSETAAFGAALLGGIAAGSYADWRDAARTARLAGRFSTIQPDAAAHEAYARPYEIFKQLYPAVRPLLH